MSSEDRYILSLESLLRQWVSQGLPLAPPKEPIPGVRGVADFNFPKLDEPIPCRDGIDGLVDFVTADPTPETGLLVQFQPEGVFVFGTNQSIHEQFADLYRSGAEKIPSKFTQQMRAVVQVLAGEKHPIDYDYKWQRTHGIFYPNRGLPAGLSNGYPWVIEIDRTTGVRAKQLPICIPEDDMGVPIPDHSVITKLGYYPAVIPGNNWWTEPDGWRVLISPDTQEFQAFYSDGALFQACGWAFDPQGGACRNTCVGSVLDTSGRGYFKFSEYEIQITASGTEPVAATITRLEEGVVYGDRVNHFRYPEETTLGGTWLVSFDWYQMQGGPSSISLGDTPFYVFHDGETWVQGRYQAPQTLEAEEYDTYDPDWNGCRPGTPGGGFDFVRGVTTSSKIAAAYVSKAGAPKTNYVKADQVTRGVVTDMGPLTIWIIAADWVYRYEEGYLGYAITYSNSESRTCKSCVNIPFNDREALYSYKREIVITTRSDTVAGGCASPMYGGAGGLYKCTKTWYSCPSDQCEDGNAFHWPGTYYPSDTEAINWGNKQGVNGKEITEPRYYQCPWDTQPQPFFCMDYLTEPNVAADNNGTDVEDHATVTLYASGPVTLSPDLDQSWCAFCETGIMCAAYLHLVPDGLNPGRVIASKTLAPINSNPDSYVANELGSYTLDGVTGAKEKYWVGDPGDLLSPP